MEEGVIDAVLERLFLGGDESGGNFCGQTGGICSAFAGSIMAAGELKFPPNSISLESEIWRYQKGQLRDIQ